MKHQLYSVYGASRALERDRQTIERAVRGLTPDGSERGHPRWRLARIVEALSHRNARGSLPADQALQDRFDRLDALDVRVRAAPTLPERRKLARELFVTLQGTDRAMREDARRSGEDRELTALRCDRHLQTVLWTLREPCGWSFDEIWSEFNAVETGQLEVM
jgi:hypothetical protein